MDMDERLQYIATLVRRGSRLADIGTDHAYLPVYLVGQGICRCAVAGDVRQGPAANARKAVQQAGLEQQISVRVGDGLSVLNAGEADDIVIAGMGGETIAAILQAAPWIRDRSIRLILQPMSRPEQMRAFLLRNGFSLLHEATVVSSGRRYLVTVAAFTDAAPQPEWRHFVGVLHPQREKDFLLKQLSWIRAREKGLAADGEMSASQRYAALAREVQLYIDGETI